MHAVRPTARLSRVFMNNSLIVPSQGADSAPKKAREGSHAAVLLSFRMNGRSGGDFVVPLKMTLEKAVCQARAAHRPHAPNTIRQLLEYIKYDDAHLWHLSIPGIGKVCNALYQGDLDGMTMATKVTLEQVKPITGDRWPGVHDLGDNNRCVDCTRGVLTLCRMEIFIKNHDLSTTEANKVTRASPGSVRTAWCNCTIYSSR